MGDKVLLKNETGHKLDSKYTGPCTVESLEANENTIISNNNKGERYSRVPRLSDTRYSAKWRYASSKARVKCATYRFMRYGR